VTQGVFVALAQNARQLTNHPVLSGWLHRTARNLAANTVRSETRRRTREQEAVAMNQLNETEADWEMISLHLDNALSQLDEADRDALMLRYFERKSAREMANILGLSEEAAQKRTSRAVESLREFFSKQRVTIGAGGLAVLISTNAVQSAPIEMRVTILAAVAKIAAGVGLGTKGLAATKIGTILGSAGAFIPMLGSFYLTFKAKLEDAKSPRERQLMVHFFRIQSILIVILAFLIIKFLTTSSFAQTKEALFSVALIFVLFGLLFSFVRYSKKRRRIQIEDGTWVESEPVTDKQRKELLANVRANGSKRLMYLYLGQACVFLGMTMTEFKPGFNGNWKHAAWLIFLFGFTIFSGIQAWRSRPR
jgi:RNA polymerase sigma factor (sigma-70 family)